MNPKEIQRILRAIALRLGGPVKADEYEFDPFTFTMNYLPATLSVTTQAQFTVQQDSAFAITRTTIVVTDTADAFVANLSDTPKVMPFLMTLSDSGSGRNLMDIGVHVDNLFGSAQRPYIWSTPKILDPSSTFQGSLQNISATSRNVRIAFHGYKIFGNIEQYLVRSGRRR